LKKIGKPIEKSKIEILVTLLQLTPLVGFPAMAEKILFNYTQKNFTCTIQGNYENVLVSLQCFSSLYKLAKNRNLRFFEFYGEIHQS
jgi:hypothetical protein